jgi:hypothetical protein
VGRTDAEIEDLAQAWLRYWTWFSTEGIVQFEEWQARSRKVMDPWYQELAEAERNKEWTRFDALLNRNPMLKMNRPHGHEDEWAADELRELLSHDDDGWRMLLTLVRLAPDELLGQIGAGPLEDFIAEDEARAERLIERFRLELARDPRFRAMARQAWGMPTLIAEAIASAPNP